MVVISKQKVILQGTQGGAQRTQPTRTWKRKHRNKYTLVIQYNRNNILETRRTKKSFLVFEITVFIEN